MIHDKGFYDFHVHIGEQISGYDLSDSFTDLRRLTEPCDDPANPPLLGIGAFVTEEAEYPLAQKLEAMKERAERDLGIPIHWHLSPTHSRLEDIYDLLEAGHDLKLYTTYRSAGLYKSYEEIGRWMQDLCDLKTRILVHCEDDLIIGGSQTHSFRTPFDHTFRRPEIAEDKAVGAILNLAVRHSHPVHIVHVSSPTSALMIKEAKRDFDGISCETTPHYLLYNEERLREPNGHRYLTCPPYRKESSRGLLAELFQDGVFDILASDHCSFADSLKDRYQKDLEKIPMGIPGISTLYSSIYEAFVAKGKISAEALDQMLRIKPRELMNFGGES
jgi:dihydropyrimidinase